MGRNNNELSSATTTTTSSSSSRFVAAGHGEERGQTLEDFANALCDGGKSKSSGGKKQKGGGGDDARNAFFIEVRVILRLFCGFFLAVNNTTCDTLSFSLPLYVYTYI